MIHRIHQLKHLLLCILLCSSPALAEEKPPIDFAQWLQEQSQVLHKKGIRKTTLRNAFHQLTPDESVVQLDRRQPEATQSFGQYLAKRITPQRIEEGKKQMHLYRTLLSQVVKDNEIPKSILTSLWSLESNYGTYTGKRYIIRSLATLAYDGRRKALFERELHHALMIMQKNKLNQEDFLGSWAGAMGQIQFLPSTYINYAVDGNQDGKINLWNNMHDIFYSASNYLKKMAWHTDETWGQEIILPHNMDWTHNGLEWSLPLENWISRGIKPANGVLPSDRKTLKASLLLPMGYGGPAFLIYDNFRTIMRWNHSVHYALTVGILSDLLNGKYNLEDLPIKNWKRNYPSPTVVRKLQSKLSKAGHSIGKIDGVVGSKTRRAIIDYQIKYKLIPDGYPNPEFLQHLNIK